ncbi:prepilin-type N-terminal cleavage/methylation domain-containing protein [Stigmatella hybrida]|uniref:prepilin-type N-terminal cleavage/methylation domain-containing protein n=1 Tax=Stigmatella hybrida TaxID=394097 RepID=UPI001CDA8CBB|nr:prepilin-type N-terminal cleavage/methylation domain-containing protein [Stigmatella hybrida]
MRLSRRGFTLIELLVGGAVGSVVLLGISLTFMSQARQYQTHASRRSIQANARQAMSFMSRNLRSAGYGVNPDRAIIAYDSYNAATDLAQTGYPDAIAVHSRDLLFRRDITSASANSLTVSTPVARLERGQILLVLCRNSGAVSTTQQHAFVTVGQRVVNSTQIPLDPTDPGSAPNSPMAMPGRLFHEQSRLESHACYDTAQVVKIHRAAFYVAAFDEPGSPRRTPYLMMHQGTDLNGDNIIDAADAVPIAEGIEQLQVAYILNSVKNAMPRIIGVNEATSPEHYGEEWQTMVPTSMPGPDWYMRWTPPEPLPPGFEDPREADSPVNIRQVRVTLVSRSSVPDPQHTGDNLMLSSEGTLIGGIVPWRQLENLSVTGLTPNTKDFTPQEGGYYRVILRESVTPKNLQLNSQFIATTEAGG